MSVLIYTQNWDGQFKKSTYELVSYGAKVAEMMGGEAVAVSIGNVADDQLATLGAYGAAKVVSIKNDNLNTLDNQLYTAAISEVANKMGAKVIVLGHNNEGKAIAPRLAVRMKAGIASAVNKLPESVEPFKVSKKVFSGNAFANVVIKSDVKVLTLMQNSFDVIDNGGTAAVEAMDIAAGEAKTTVTNVDKVTGKVILTDAEIVISGGRGMKGPENWGPIEELADILGGATACSRPVSDEGWRPHGEHTGQTGKIVAPNLYVAAGISGAIQHLAGVSSSKCIVAINKDADAPIFEAADYGIIGDAQEVLPKLVDAVKAFKGM